MITWSRLAQDAHQTTGAGNRTQLATAILAVLATLLATETADAQYRAVVPGTGIKIKEVGDDFEDDKWTWTNNLPKASANIDEEVRYPAGTASNNKLYESTYRGQPEVIKRIKTPEGGLAGSKASLLMRSLETGIPSRPSFKQQQDDVMLNVNYIVGGLSVARTPQFVVRVYMPEWEYWEKRTGSTFGVRADCVTTVPERSAGRGWFSRRISGTKVENYWPGLFVQHNMPVDPKKDKHSAVILIRGDKLGHEITGPTITKPGWWTMGMSFTPDGAVHYYAREGVGDLRPKDHITSQYPYGFRCETVNTFFFNVSNGDDGRTWSTPWVVDDPMVYVLSN